MDFTGREFWEKLTDRIVCPTVSSFGADQREKLVARLLIVTESQSMALVTADHAVFPRRRICMQRWRASIITPTP